MSLRCFLNIFPHVIAISYHFSLFFKHVTRKMFSVINFQLLKIVKKPLPPNGHPLYPPSGGQIQPGHPQPLLPVKLPPLSAQLPSSTHSGSQIHLSPPSGHPPPQLATLLAANLTHPHPAVFHTFCWWTNSHLPPTLPAIGVSRGEG